MLCDSRTVAGQISHDTPLHPIVGVTDGALIRPLSDSIAFNPNGMARAIHHDEHVFKTAVFLTHKVAHCAPLITIGENGRRAAVYT